MSTDATPLATVFAKGSVQDGDPNAAPSNPYFREAIQLAEAGDSEGLRELSQRVCDMGYAAQGQLRQFIAARIQALENSTS